MTDSPDRHVHLSVIEDYFAKKLDGVVGIDGKPPARLVITPSDERLSIRLPATYTAPDVSSFTNLSVDLVEDQGFAWLELSVQIEDNLNEVYALLCSVVDRVQLLGVGFDTAVADALDSLSEILATRTSLSDDQQLGLAGELLTVLALADQGGPNEALESWRGPMAEEHDFGLASGDVEVKVTLNERRKHWVSSLTQLVPTGHRPLYLLSIQLTSSGGGAGWSLPALVEMVRGIPAMHREALDLVVASAGYRDGDADLYRSRWTLRTPPEFFLVDDQFPKITQGIIEAAVPSSQRVIDVRYRVDLTGLKPSPRLFEFDDPSGGAKS
jgi:hypothetical protein